MRTRKTTLISASALLLAVLLALSLSGCGSSSVSASALLSKSSQNIANVSSAKMRMDMSGSAAAQSLLGSMEVEQAKTPDGFQMKMTANAAGQSMVMYLIGDTVYMNILGQWSKMSVPVGSNPTSQISMGSLDHIQKMMADAEDAKVISDDASSTTIGFKLGPDFMKKQLAEAKTKMGDLGTTVDPAMLGDTSLDITVKINKSDNLVSEMTEKIKMSGGSLGNVDTTVKMTLEGYNVPVNTQPPPEAMRASEMKLPSLDSLTPGL